MPLAPVCRPKDIPEDHEVDIWVFLYTINFKQTYNDWRNVAMTGSTKPSSDDSNSDYHHENSNHDPRLVDSLDPRLPKMANEIMTGLLNHNDNPSTLSETIQEQPWKCQFEPTVNEEMTVEQAKQILQKTMTQKEEKKINQNQREYIEENKKKEVKMVDFNVDNFRMNYEYEREI